MPEKGLVSFVCVCARVCMHDTALEGTSMCLMMHLLERDTGTHQAGQSVMMTVCLVL